MMEHQPHQDPQLDIVLRHAFRELSVLRGACPSPEALVTCLSAEHNSSDLEDHLAMCPDCALAVWNAGRFRNSFSTSRSPIPRLVVAAALIVILVPATLYFLRKPAVLDVPVARAGDQHTLMEEARVFEGSTKRGITTAVTGTEPMFLLSVFVPLRDQTIYDAYVLRSTGAEVSRIRNVSGVKATGSVQIAFRRDAFSPGGYVLRIVERLPGGQAYEFPFQVQ